MVKFINLLHYFAVIVLLYVVDKFALNAEKLTIQQFEYLYKFHHLNHLHLLLLDFEYRPLLLNAMILQSLAL